MESAVKLIKTLRTHWKKSTLAFCLTVYGYNYMKNRHKDNLLRRHYCTLAQKYGKEKIALNQRPRRVTVFLNPAAKGGKAKKIFEKTAAPILYLAGIEINLVQTEYEGQLKKFMSALDTADTDAIVIAGGGGTLVEAVTGLMRKEEDKKSTSIPLGVIPLGNSNRFSKLWFGGDPDEVKTIAEASFSVVQAVTEKVDVIKFVGSEDKTIYGLIGLEAGIYRDAEERKAKYWYFGPLKSYWTYLRSTMGRWPATLQASMSYVEATKSNMQLDNMDVEELELVRQRWNFVDFLLGRSKKKFEVQDQKYKEKFEQLEKEDEMNRVSKHVTTMEIIVTNDALIHKDAPFHALKLSIGPEDMRKSDFIREGWSRTRHPKVIQDTEMNESLMVKKVFIDLKEKDQSFNIDGETFEAMPVDISLLRNRLNMFCRPT